MFFNLSIFFTRDTVKENYELVQKSQCVFDYSSLFINLKKKIFFYVEKS